ncbi:sodium:proton antiporter [Lentibacillus sp. N15]|uniref:cation:proton antiporter n=1 Tax=Lentibacillus songyuanensis TaxID=3136161 RepID=UPI0031B9F56E
MEQAALISIVVILGLGIFSQWLAWRIQWPSIVIMSIAGLLIGPVFGLINPQAALGDLYSPLISLAVAVVLFEGSSSLDVRELRGISKSVFRIVTFGAFLAWIGGSLAAYYIAGLSLEVAFIIGGLFIVTGPTVIIPLLRQAKLKSRTATVLKWEGIIVDPFGPLLALFAYQVIKILVNEHLSFQYLWNFFLGAVFAVILGFIIGILVSVMVSRGLFPEYLKSPIILSFVLLCFMIGEVVMHETGMLAVTVMGLSIGRSKKYVSSIENVGHFVENISVILTSTIFILLTASLTREVIGQVFTLPIIGFVIVMLFIVRPLSIWISTIKTELSIAEKTLISWIAPRGVVALTVSGYFASVLIDDGYQDATLLTALTFALVFITVCAHGFTIGPLAKKLKLASSEPPGVLIVGASSFSVALAKSLQQFKIPVLITDSSEDRLQPAMDKGIETFQGEILAEHTQFEIDFVPYETILAMTGDAAYNALIYQSYVPEFGYNNTFVLPVESPDSDEKGKEVATSLKAHLLFGEDAIFRELNRQVNTSYSIKTVEIDEKHKVNKEDIKRYGTPLFVKKKDDSLEFITWRQRFTLDDGDELVLLGETRNKN